MVYLVNQQDTKKKAIPVTGREGPEGCETSRLTVSRQSAHR
jgi:hypothetical protein